VVNIQNRVESWQELASWVNPIVHISVANLGYKYYKVDRSEMVTFFD
jgi:hypothetical protein